MSDKVVFVPRPFSDSSIRGRCPNLGHRLWFLEVSSYGTPFGSRSRSRRPLWTSKRITKEPLFPWFSLYEKDPHLVSHYSGRSSTLTLYPFSYVVGFPTRLSSYHEVTKTFSPYSQGETTLTSPPLLARVLLLLRLSLGLTPSLSPSLCSLFPCLRVTACRLPPCVRLQSRRD